MNLQGFCHRNKPVGTSPQLPGDPSKGYAGQGRGGEATDRLAPQNHWLNAQQTELKPRLIYSLQQFVRLK